MAPRPVRMQGPQGATLFMVFIVSDAMVVLLLRPGPLACDFLAPVIASRFSIIYVVGDISDRLPDYLPCDTITGSQNPCYRDVVWGV